MASYHLQIKTGKRGQAANHSAYITRSGKYGKGEKGQDLLATGSGNMPSWAQDNPKNFWKEADKHERNNGSTFRELELSLPSELTASQNQALIVEFIQKEVGVRPFEFAIHAPIASLGNVLQPHAHVMINDRLPDHIERTPDQYFKRFNPTSPELGGCKKASGGLHRGQMKDALVNTRKLWAETQNKYLQMHGHDSRVDHRSLKDQGIHREPERHLGPARVKLMSEQDKANYVAGRSR